MSSFVRAALLSVLFLLQASAFAADPSPVKEAALELEFKAAFDVLMAGQLQAGLTMMEATLKRSQRELGEQAAHTLKVHDYYGGALMRLSRNAEAKREFELILVRHREAGSERSRGALASLNNLGNAVARLESPQAALPLFKQAFELRASTLGDDDMDSSTVLADYAWALSESGQVHQSLALIEQALALRTRLQGERHSWTLTTMNNLGHTLAQLGRYADALAVHEKVLKLRLAESGERHPSTLVSMNNTALMLKHMGRFEEARTLHQRAVALQTETLGRSHFSTMTGRRGLASDLLSLGRLGEARAALQELLADSERVYGRPHRHAQYTRFELAVALEKLGRLDEALAELETLLAIYLETAGPDHFDTLGAATQRAHLLRLLGRTGAAAAALRELHPRAVAQYGAVSVLSLNLATELALALEAQGELAQAEGLLAQVVGAAEALRADLPAGQDDSRRQQHQQFAEAYRLRVRVLAGLGRLDEAFAMLERSKARSLLEQMSERGMALAAGVRPAQWSALQTAREQAHVQAARLREARDPLERQQRLDDVQRALQAVAALQAQLRTEHPRYTRVASLEPAGARDSTLLPRGALLLSYSLEADNRVSAMTLDGQGRLQWHALGQQPGLADSIESLRLWSTQEVIGHKRVFSGDAGQRLEIVRWLQEDGQPRWRVVPADSADVCLLPGLEPASCRPAGALAVWQRTDYDELRQALGARLLQPLQARLSGHARWIVSPDKSMGLLPFDLLPWRQGRPLESAAQHAAVSQLQSLSVLRAATASWASRARTGRSLALLAIGNPEFEPGQTAAHWPQLAAAQVEMTQAAAQFRAQATRVISSRDASETRLRQLSDSGELASARHLLFSTHAWFDAEHPDASLLVLRAAGPAAAEDGKLSSGDLAGLALNSQLVVLSACNTARSDSRSNDGQFGLAYALGLAGNRNALLTLWPVLDSASADFVTRFFAHVAKGRPHVLALQATKREFMRHPNPRWREPRYWAGFVLFGV